jgi:hypothetical protein
VSSSASRRRESPVARAGPTLVRFLEKTILESKLGKEQKITSKLAKVNV